MAVCWYLVAAVILKFTDPFRKYGFQFGEEAMKIELKRSSPCIWMPATYGIMVGGRHMP